MNLVTRMRTRASFTSVFAVTVLMAITTPAPAADLVVDGRPTGRIVTPGRATECEQFAAEELQIYIRKVSGATVPIVTTDDPGDDPSIIVGDHPLNRPVAERLSARYPDRHEALAVVAAGSRLHLAGASETGRLNAAWDWIERQLGVRWFFPTEMGEYVPKRGTIRIEPIEVLDAPHVRWRSCSVWTTSPQQTPELLGRIEHGFEGWKLFRYRSRNSERLPFAPQDSWLSLGGAHAYRLLLPVEKYGAEHPQWFNKLDGTQPPSHGAQVNFSSREAADAYARNALSYVEGSLGQGIPVERMVIWNGPADGVARCELPENQALIDNDGSGTSMVVNFGNMVAERILAEHPKARVVHHVYSNHARPPDKVQPLSGTGAIVSHWCGGEAFGYNHAEPGFSDGNRRYRAGWNRWLELVDHIGIYCYYGHYSWATPFPMLTQMANDFPIMADSGKFDYIQAQLHAHWGTQGITFYVLSKLAWNPYADVDALRRDYCHKGFGSAGPVIERYFRTLQTAMDELPHVSGSSLEIPNLLTPDLIRRCDALIDEAESHLPAMDPPTRWRTMIVTQGWRGSAMIGEVTGMFIHSKDPSDRARIAELRERIDELMSSKWGILAFDTPRARKKVIGQTMLVPLGNLPPGDHKYNDQLMFGGATRFNGRVEGFKYGRWGWNLAGGAKGRVRLPVRPADGHRIAKATVEILMHGRPDVALRVKVAKDDQAPRLIAEGTDIILKAQAIPDDLLSGAKVTVIVEVDNLSDRQIISLTGIYLELTVE